MGKLDNFAKLNSASNFVTIAAAYIAKDLCHSADFLRLYRQVQPDAFASDSDVANAYFDLFANNKAIEVYDNAIAASAETDPANANFLRIHKAKCLGRLGDLDGALALLDSVTTAEPANAAAYQIHSYLLAIYTRRYAEAAAYADTALALLDKNTDYACSILYLRMIGNHRLGNKTLAEADARTIINVEKELLAQAATSSPDLKQRHNRHLSLSNSRYAFAILGLKDQAIAAINEGLKPDVDLDQFPTYEKYIEAAETYSLLSMPSETLAYLTKALEAGYRDFIYIERSPSYDAIRDLPDFANLISTYQAKYRSEIEALNN